MSEVEDLGKHSWQVLWQIGRSPMAHKIRSDLQLCESEELLRSQPSPDKSLSPSSSPYVKGFPRDEIENPLSESQILEVPKEVESVEADDVVKDAEDLWRLNKFWRLPRLNL